MHTQLTTIGLIAALAAPAGAQLAAEEGASTLEDRFDKLWSYATLYKNEDNSVIRSSRSPGASNTTSSVLKMTTLKLR